MSRLLPRRGLVEATIDGTWIHGNFLDISEILPVSSRLGDSILRAEYPAGRTPPEFIGMEVLGDYLWLKTNVSLRAGEDIRLVYQGTWTPPTPTTPGDYPPHLDNVVVVGASGQSLIYKAEYFVRQSAETAERLPDLLDALAALAAVVLPDVTLPSAPTTSIPAAPSEYTFIKPTAPTLSDIPTSPTAPGDLTLSALTPPDFTDFVSTDMSGKYDPPTPPSLPSVFPSAPSAPAISTQLTAANTALDAAIARFVAAVTTLSSMNSPLDCGAERISLLPAAVVNARTYLGTGEPLINKVTVGSDVGSLFNQYAVTEVAIARESVQSGVAYVQIAGGWEAKAARDSTIGMGYIQEATQRLASAGKILDGYAQEVNVYRTEVDAIAVETNALVALYQAEMQGEATGASIYAAAVDGFRAQVVEQANLVQKYSADIQRYLTEIHQYGEEVRFLITKYQAEIQAESVGVQDYATRVNAFEAVIRGEEGKINIFAKEVEAYAAAMKATETQASVYATQAQTIKSNIDSCIAQQKQYIELAGRYLASGQSKINEFLISLGHKPELSRSASSSEQRT